jgi:hypothetical protein
MNALPSKLTIDNPGVILLPREYESMYEHTYSFVAGNYAALLIIFATCFIMSVLPLKPGDRKNNR